MQVIAYEQLYAQHPADTDHQLMALWLHGRPASTQEAYGADIARFLAFVDKPLRSVTLGAPCMRDLLSRRQSTWRCAVISHLFLLPQTMPESISCAIRGWSVAAAHSGDCWAAYRIRARTTAELPTVQPKVSEASWRRCSSVLSAS